MYFLAFLPSTAVVNHEAFLPCKGSATRRMPRTITRFHDCFRGSLPQILAQSGYSTKTAMEFLGLYSFGRYLLKASKKALWRRISRWLKKSSDWHNGNNSLSKKDMSQEKPITHTQETGSPTSSPQRQFNHARIIKPFLHLCEVRRTEEFLCFWHQRRPPRYATSSMPQW